MKRFLLISILIISVFSSCSKSDEGTALLNVNVTYDYNATKSPFSGVTVYLFKDINLVDPNDPTVKEYSYVGNGVLKKISTGDKIQYSEKKVTNQGTVQFNNLSTAYQTVVVDASSILKAADFSDRNWQISSINLNNKSEANLSFSFDISPYTPLDLGL